MTKRKLKPAIPNESFAPLGKVVANFAVLESSLDFAIWLLLVGNSSAEQRTGQIVTAELTFKNKIALLSSLYQHRFPTKAPFATLKEIRKKLSAANIKRNDLVHSTWLAGGKKVTTTAKERYGIKIEFQDMNAGQIDGIGDFISEVSAEMQEFYISFLK
ncbi:hypothetical protein COT42_01840 [Candidatus Saganbacteria bacterium CG08_land_8_20_14_0_20_45_16]|uniref:Uncharacterized protein n=1 Tax=Candidatus Saganbacteria bacterium CG08_land_8_20_14_0_20_45_16 TaxID=2014293 RepID=A0A2H0Y0Q7_UNCSA|nr:MAG: hypothetical protein COT42_01840 [Candidatus Saganbacteria bacterium CG08_land_8_20_14_0_20_45_16]